jgi:uncharacterized protein (DUF952 family)
VKPLFHIVPRGTAVPDLYAPPSLSSEGFIHLSYADAVRESARLYFAGLEVDVWCIDPAKVVDLREDPTPRGPMPHAYAPIPRAAIVRVCRLDEID